MTGDLPRAAAAVVTAGRSLGLELDVREFPEGTRTTADAAPSRSRSRDGAG